MKRSRLTRLSSLLETSLARFGLDRRLDDFRVWQAWDAVVGPAIARNAQPVRLDGSRLIVTVRSSTWLQELSLLQKELIVRLNEWMTREVVRELFFVVGRVDDAASKSGRGAARTTIGEPQGQLPRRTTDEALTLVTPPPSEELSPEVAETFERLWRAARARGAAAEKTAPPPRKS